MNSIPSLAEVWGTTAHTCPYCDGYEHRDERLAILAAGARGEHLAILLRQWSDDGVLLSNGPHGLDADQLARVQALGIPIIETPVIAMNSDEGGHLRRPHLDDGETLDRNAPFFYVGWQFRNDAARRLGCQLHDDGSRASRRALPTNERQPHAPRGGKLRERPSRNAVDESSMRLTRIAVRHRA